jgi:exodeoxyribonuclease-3
MKILSWNVNGLRAVMNKGFISFINDYQPDILGLQETKLQESQIPLEISELPNYEKYWNYAERKGYSGTCLLSKRKPNTVYTCDDVICTSKRDFINEGRIIQAEYKDFVLFNIYFPNGQMSDERLDFKLDFYDKCLNYFESIRQTGKNIIVMGDFNTAHKPIDLTHPKANEKYSGFLPIEREWLDKFVSFGYIDTFRHFNQEPEHYSWWSYRLNARGKNVGWRIDYVFVNSEFIERVKNAFILPEVLGSDHCPVGIEIS